MERRSRNGLAAGDRRKRPFSEISDCTEEQRERDNPGLNMTLLTIPDYPLSSSSLDSSICSDFSDSDQSLFSPPLPLSSPSSSSSSLPTSSSSSAKTTATEAGVKRNKKKRAGKKSTYKHIPHCLKPPHLVAKRNARERRRVQAVNSAFSRLRKHVPYEPRSKRLSKVKTLRCAIDYIYSLRDLIYDHDRHTAQGSTLSPHTRVTSLDHSDVNPVYDNANARATGTHVRVSNGQQDQRDVRIATRQAMRSERQAALARIPILDQSDNSHVTAKSYHNRRNQQSYNFNQHCESDVLVDQSATFGNHDSEFYKLPEISCPGYLQPNQMMPPSNSNFTFPNSHKMPSDSIMNGNLPEFAPTPPPPQCGLSKVRYELRRFDYNEDTHFLGLNSGHGSRDWSQDHADDVSRDHHHPRNFQTTTSHQPSHVEPTRLHHRFLTNIQGFTPDCRDALATKDFPMGAIPGTGDSLVRDSSLALELSTFVPVPALVPDVRSSSFLTPDSECSIENFTPHDVRDEACLPRESFPISESPCTTSLDRAQWKNSSLSMENYSTFHDRASSLKSLIYPMEEAFVSSNFNEKQGKSYQYPLEALTFSELRQDFGDDPNYGLRAIRSQEDIEPPYDGYPTCPLTPPAPPANVRSVSMADTACLLKDTAYVTMSERSLADTLTEIRGGETPFV